jgi:hypothetical protein
MTKLSMRRLKKLVRWFKERRKSVWHNEKRKYEAPGTLSEAVDAALGLRPGDKIQDHQRRVGRAVLRRAQKKLQRNHGALLATQNFDELLSCIEQLTFDVDRFGDLAVYDVACRLGIFRRMRPNFVHLHAGTREGARAFGLSGKKVSPKRFYPALRGLKAHQIEDFLCINKDVLRGRRSWLSACRYVDMKCREYHEGRSC